MKVNEENLWEVSRAKQNLEDFIDFIEVSMPASESREDVFGEQKENEVTLSIKGFPSKYSDIIDRPTLVVWIFDENPKRKIRTISKHVTSRGAKVEVEDGPGEVNAKMLVYYDVISRDEKREVMDKLDF